MLNKMLSKKYEITREIGRGGMGVIYEALDTALNRKVAIKVLHAQFSGDAAFLKRFQREARAMARLDHEHIIKVYDVGEEDGLHYIVMEYFAGEDLKISLSAIDCLSQKEALSIVLQVSDALSYSHAQGVIHRDIKPANIMVSSSGVVKIADFGIAAATDEISLTSTGSIIGTPAYMSPEQANGELLDGRSDLYSLGMVFYELLTGKTPYSEVSGRAILVKIVTEQKEFKLIFPAQTSHSIQDLVGNLLRKNKDNRITDAKTLSRMLTKIEAHPLDLLAKTLVVSESSLSEKIVSPSKGRIYAAGIALLLVFFIGVSYKFSPEKEKKGRPTPVPIPAESSSLDEIQGLQRSIRDIQKKLRASGNEADHPETRRLASELFEQAIEIENRGAKALENAENLILRQNHQAAKAKLQRVLGLFTQANEAYLEAKERTEIKKVEEKRQVAEQEQLSRKRDQEALEKEKLGQEKKALMLLVDAERKKREKLEQDNRDRKRRERKKLEREKQKRILRAKAERLARERKNLAQERAQVKQKTHSTRPDIEVTSGLFFKLKQAYEKKDLRSLQEMSEMTQQQARFLRQIFKTYKTIKVKILNFSVTGRSSQAMVSITKLTFPNNKSAIPEAPWKDSKLVIHKNDGQWGKILW